MTSNLTLCILAGLLFGCGINLLLARSLVRALLGVLLVSNGVNMVYVVAMGVPGRAPVVGKGENPPIGAEGITDPLPQALVLTAIVITLATTAFTLALAHRSWQISRTDVVADDAEDVRTHERAVANDLSDSDYLPSGEALDDISPETDEDDEIQEPAEDEDLHEDQHHGADREDLERKSLVDGEHNEPDVLRDGTPVRPDHDAGTDHYQGGVGR